MPELNGSEPLDKTVKEQPLKGRSLLTLADYSKEEITYLLDLAAELKEKKRSGNFDHRLTNRNIALIFLKPSSRTRMSFVVAAADEGANLEVFRSEDIRIGIKESIADLGRLLGRMFDGIAFRGFEHEVVQSLAEYSQIPVWNGLCDMFHPTQLLADMLTIREIYGRIEGVNVTYVGDARNNLGHSLSIAASKMGFNLTLAAPKALWPDLDPLNARLAARGEAPIDVRLVEDPQEGVKDADIVYGDVWVSMGEEDVIDQRIALLKPYKVTESLMAATGKEESVYLHCLPAFHDLETEFARTYPDACEVEDAVFEKHQARIFDQAENRMHTIKAVMVATL